MNIISFAYKNKSIPKDYFIIDCRILKNPWSVPELRNLTGNDAKVMDWLMENDRANVNGLLEKARNCGSDKIAFDCYGGKHRSVAMVNFMKNK